MSSNIKIFHLSMTNEFHILTNYLNYCTMFTTDMRSAVFDIAKTFFSIKTRRLHAYDEKDA